MASRAVSIQGDSDCIEVLYSSSPLRNFYFFYQHPVISLTSFNLYSSLIPSPFLKAQMALASFLSFLSFYFFPSPTPSLNGIKARTEHLTSVVFGRCGESLFWRQENHHSGALVAAPLPWKLDYGISVSSLFSSPTFPFKVIFFIRKSGSEYPILPHFLDLVFLSSLWHLLLMRNEVSAGRNERWGGEIVGRWTRKWKQAGKTHMVKVKYLRPLATLWQRR